MKITVVTMGMMQMPVNQVVHMVAMRNLLMPASETVDMGSVVPGTGMTGCALSRIRRIDL